MIRTAQDVMAVARSRGFRFRVNPGPPPMPEIVGHKERSSEALVDALKAFRLEIIEIVLAEQAKGECNGQS